MADPGLFPMAMSEQDVEAVVREVTDEEAVHYREYGWVMMRGLVEPAFADGMLRALRDYQGDFKGNPAKNGVEPFRSFVFSRRMTSNAAKLVNRARLKGVDVPMRWHPESASPTGVSKPAGMSPSEEMPEELKHYDANGVLLGSGYHTDSAEHGADRVGELQFWLALGEVTVEMGPMRYINRSHREILGSVFNAQHQSHGQGGDDLGGAAGYRASGNILDQYPLLTTHPDFGVSEPEETHYQLGDCTVHHGYCAHGSINNTTDRDRCSYLFSYSPADTRYWGRTQLGNVDGGGNNGARRQRVEDNQASPVVYLPPPLGETAASPAIPPLSPSVGEAMSEQQVEAVVREVTAEEVAHYHEFGWVMMRGLVAPAFTAELLRVLQTEGQTRHPASDGVEPFRSMVFSQRCTSNAVKLCDKARFKGVDVPLRYRGEMPVIKQAGQQPSEEQPSELQHHDTNGVLLGSGFHQDACEHGSDRGGELQFWMALDEVTPDQGPMRFINRTHKEGPLGSVFNDDGDDLGGVAGYRASGNLLDQYPLLPQVLGISEVFETHYMPGDVTVHHGFCAHGSINNTTDRDRLGYLWSFSPADTRYWGENGSSGNPGSLRLRAEDESEFPVMYRPAPFANGVEAKL